MQFTEKDIATYIDLDSALTRIRGNVTIYKKMLNLFLMSEEFEAFENALGEGDNARAAEVAHGIKGMTGNLGFTPLFELSTALMLQLRQGAAEPDVLEKYRQTLDATKACVQIYMEQE